MVYTVVVRVVAEGAVAVEVGVITTVLGAGVLVIVTVDVGPFAVIFCSNVSLNFHIYRRIDVPQRQWRLQRVYGDRSDRMRPQGR